MPRVFARLVVAAACAAARKAPPQIAVRDAAFDVRAVGRSKSVGGAASAFDATVETEDGRCLKLSGARCAEDAASSGVAAAEHVDLLVAATEANCAGFVGLWHFLIKCLSTLLEDFKGFVDALPGEERPAAIVFLDPTNSREASGPCAFGPFVEGYRPLLEAIFPVPRRVARRGDSAETGRGDAAATAFEAGSPADATRRAEKRALRPAPTRP
mmetsp:Transcript_4959/g.15023  ORF Transcript_4959/g.15023 Transcript_4959/m.15023 type:complete len:213 (-) Transcript_4959:973-1611(-)